MKIENVRIGDMLSIGTFVVKVLDVVDGESRTNGGSDGRVVVLHVKGECAGRTSYDWCYPHSIRIGRVFKPVRQIKKHKL